MDLNKDEDKLLYSEVHIFILKLDIKNLRKI